MTDPTPQPIVPTQVQPETEYVAGTAYWLAYRGSVRALPHAIDELESELGDDLYTRMLTDPRVAGDVGLLRATILEAGITINAADTPEGDDAAAELAADARAFVERCLLNLTIPVEDVLDDMLDALAYGSRIAEQVYAPGEGDDAGRLILKAIKPKPRKVTAFAVDAFLNVVGIVAAEPGRPLLTTTFLSNTAPNLYPREKFAVLSYRPRNSDPRGRTVLRPAYNFWWLKTQFLPELLKFGAQFGTPSLVGTTEESASGDGTKSAQDLLLERLLAFQNGTALALPYGAMVKTLESAMASSGDSFFERAIDLCDRQISIAILGTTRATNESENGSRADSQTARGLFDSHVRAGRQALAAMLDRDVIRPLLAYNNTAWLSVAPYVTLGGVAATDRTGEWSAVANLERSGYLDPSQYAPLDAQIGLPPRTPEEAQQRAERKAAPPMPPMMPMPPAPSADEPEDPEEEPDDESR